jgi:hypothetical protein
VHFLPVGQGGGREVWFSFNVCKYILKMKKRLVASLLVVLVVVINCAAKESKSEKKNRKIVAKEERHYQKSLRKHTDTATTYLDHANKLATINSECSKAPHYYQAALKYDSANAAIYKGYGAYLADRARAYTDARKMLDAGLALAPGDSVIKKYLASVNASIALQEEDNRQRDFGTTAVKEIPSGLNYASITKFDSLKIVVGDAGSKYYYQTLLSRFLADDTTLTPAEMYLLIVGYSRQPSYNPFNYNDITEIKMVASHNIDAAIKKGEELTKTNPLNPSLNRELMYYSRKKNDAVQAGKYLWRIQQYFNGMLYSGNGSCDKPYISLWAKEEYNFITYLGYKTGDNHSMGMCAGQMAEVIEMINPATQKTEPVHFNVALIYMQTVGK